MKFVLDRNNVSPNPTLEFAESLIEKARGASEIVSIGGGSTIDCAKYVAWKLNIPHTAIPTTAGTGSEVSKYAVFIQNGKKISFEDNALIPTNYILDASRVVSLPKDQTAYTGLDALSQGVESYWSPLATSESRHWSKLAIRYASKYLYESYQYPHSEVLRKKMLEAANYSGKAINITKTSICHAISYPLTIHYGIPHGQACAHTLAFFANYFGFYLMKVNSWRIKNLVRSLNAEIKITFDKDLIVKEAMENTRWRNTPHRLTKEIIYASL